MYRPKYMSFKEIDVLDISEKKIYYSNLREQCKGKGKSLCKWSNFVMSRGIAPFLRSFPIEIRGEENLPQNDSVLVVSNHSNSHDGILANEIFEKLGRPATVLAALDGLGILGKTSFLMGNATFIRRDNASSKEKGILNFCSRILEGADGIIFGESTWNLHPILPMQKLKAGVAHISLITGKPVLPMIMEYIEVPEICKRESELYSKCIIVFGEPITMHIEDSLFSQTAMIQEKMETMRRNLWNEHHIIKDKLADINPEIYENHLNIKKNKAFGFKYNTAWESQFLLQKDNEFDKVKFRDSE